MFQSKKVTLIIWWSLTLVSISLVLHFIRDAHSLVAADVGGTILYSQSGANQTQPNMLTPFWHVIPSSNGTELEIEASNVPQLGGTVYFNLNGVEETPIGPTNYEHSYTGQYSNAQQSYTAVAVLTPQSGFVGTLNLTSTINLNSSNADLRRDFVESPILTPVDIFSEDSFFQITLITSDTLTADTYLALVTNVFPAGPAPSGHQFISQNYSLRPSGSIITANKPMLLRMWYNDGLLGDADPFNLAVFRWDGSQNQWLELNGYLFASQQYLSLATTHFGTHALMAVPRWYDDFDDFDGLSQKDNVTLGIEDGAFEVLTLIDGRTEGSALSWPITPTVPIANWGTVTFSYTLESPAASLTVDVLSSQGKALLTDVISGTSLADIDPDQYPALQLRANLATTTPGETARLDYWRLTWEAASPNNTYLPFVIKTTP